MKKSRSYGKLLYREFKYGFSRFVAIFAIVALGVGFLSGLMTTTPDMYNSMDIYYDKNNMHDIRIVGTMGLTEKDAQAILDSGAVSSVMPAYQADILFEGSTVDSIYNARVHSNPFFNGNNAINGFELIEGRLPTSYNECVIEDMHSMIDPIQIGTVLKVSSQNKDLEDVFALSEITVVGRVRNPYYVSHNKESSTVGDGILDVIVYVDDEAFSYEVYTNIFATIDSIKQLNSFNDEYFNVVDTSVETLEALGIGRSEIRRAEIVDEANAELADARQEYEEKKAEAEQKLSDAEKKLSDGKQELKDAEKELADAQQKVTDGEKELADARKEYADKITKAEKEIKDGKTELNSSEKKLNSSKKELDAAKAKLDAEKPKMDAAKAEMDSAKKQLDESKALLDETKATLDASKSVLDSAKKEIDQAKEYISTLPDEQQAPALEALAPKIAEYEAGVAQYNAGKAAYDQGYIEYKEGKAKYDEGYAQYLVGKKQYDSGYAQYTSGKKAYDSGYSKFKRGERDLAKAEKDLEAAKKEATEEFDKAEKELADGKVEIADGLVKLEDAKLELSDGEKEYLDAKAEADTKLADAEKKLKDAEREIGDIGIPEWKVLDRNKNYAYANFKSDAQKVGTIATVFPLFFFLIAALVALTTMTRMVEEQRVQIGTMKALGFSNMAIGFKYMLYAGTATALGCIVGLSSGMTLFPNIIWNVYNMLYQLPALYTTFNPQYATFSAVIAAACTMGATLGACVSMLKSNPSVLMLPKAPKAGKRVFLENITPIWRRLSFLYKVTVRNIIRYKRRFFMTVIGIAGCTALLVTGFGLRDSVGDVIFKQFDLIYTYDFSVEFKDEIPADTSVFAIDGVEEFTRVSMNAVDITKGDIEKSASMLVPSDMEQFKKYVNIHTRKGQEPIEVSNGMVIVEKLASLMNIGIGDTVNISLKNEKKAAEFTVTGIMENYSDLSIYISPELYSQKFGDSPQYKMVYGISTEDMSGESFMSTMLDNEDVNTATLNETFIKTFKEILGGIDSIIVVLIICAAILAIVVLYNLTNINITERQREIATIKLLGFNDREVSSYIFRETAILTVVGALLGIFIGIVLHQFVVVTAEVDAYMFGRDINIMSYVYSMLLTLIFAVLVNMIMFRKLRKIDMVESLKANE